MKALRFGTAGALVLVGLSLLVVLGVTANLDDTVFGWFTPLDRLHPVHLVWRILVMGGQFWLVGTAVLVVSIARAWQLRSWSLLLTCLGAVFCLDVLLFVSKHLVGRTSPHSGLNEVLVGGTSYPSGHTANATVCLVLLGVLLGGRRVVVIGAVVWAFVVGVANLVLGYHWLTDVLGGWLLGAVIVVPSIAAVSRLVLLDRVPGSETTAVPHR